MRKCRALHPDVRVLAHSYLPEVRCTRDIDHAGYHLAAPYGHVVTWIEPSKLRGAAKLDGDDLPVVSPSDTRARARTSWWHRFLGWIYGEAQ